MGFKAEKYKGTHVSETDHPIPTLFRYYIWGSETYSGIITQHNLPWEVAYLQKVLRTNFNRGKPLDLFPICFLNGLTRKIFVNFHNEAYKTCTP